MRRQIARFRPLWFAAIPVLIALNETMLAVGGTAAPGWLVFGLAAVLVVLIFVRPPVVHREPVEVAAPVNGRWVSLNSPGSKVPSHGTRAYGQSHAVDILHPSDADSPPMARRGLLPNRPEDYSCFGEPVLAVAPGVVTRATDWQRDHRARNTWPAAIFMLVLEGLLRSFGGFPLIAGNHVVITHDDGTASVYAHLKHRSVLVTPGQRVTERQHIAHVGNTGNSSEPHLHVQLADRPEPGASVGLPMLWRGLEVEAAPDPRLAPYTKPPAATAIAGFPANARVFRCT
ncbi:M23 family metallopeptidase [Spiractinospora alimapuensis]|uniref:M23 family metallopeptidase n=1 Tax=Spiractinospora alimapuensis TaxID=2820884 RepID=UPI001F201F88|nr:M23 family metallopeptidase [Spiractinospora alimapuensis]QVQ53283.1 M23 family metallopeptidase [Spiractinospora alimapuensis]